MKVRHTPRPQRGVSDRQIFSFLLLSNIYLLRKMKVSQIFFTGPRKYFPTNEAAGCWCVGVVSGVCGARRMTGGWWLMAPAPGPEFWPPQAAAARISGMKAAAAALAPVQCLGRHLHGDLGWRGGAMGGHHHHHHSPAITASREPETFV